MPDADVVLITRKMRSDRGTCALVCKECVRGVHGPEVSAIVSESMAATESSSRANAALDDLYRRHVGDVYRYTYAVLGNHADAEDVTQTTFVNALRALERGETPRNASHWLLAISHNLCRQRWRQTASRPTVVELVHDVPDESAEDSDVELDALVLALQKIPPSQREALVMRELEGRPYGEIAELLGITTSALETLLFRARRSLAEELENLVTCQNAELAISKQLDGRLSRKDRRRLDEHVAECEDCARLAATAKRQRKAFKGLAVLPLPIGLALFKGAPAASAATVTTLGVAGTGIGATGVGATGAGTAVTGGVVVGGSAAGAGGAVAGGTLIGGAAAKVAAVVVAASVATGVGYQGVKVVRDEPSKAPAKTVATKRAAATSPTERGAPSATGAVRRATPIAPVKARGAAAAPGRVKPSSVVVAKANVGNSAVAKERAAEKKAERLAAVPNAKADAAKDKTPPANGKDKDKAVVAPHKPTTPPSADVGAEPKPKPNEGSNGNGPGTTPPGQASSPTSTPPASSEAGAGATPPPTEAPPPGPEATQAPPAPVSPAPTDETAGDEHGTARVGNGHAKHDAKHDGKDG